MSLGTTFGCLSGGLSSRAPVRLLASSARGDVQAVAKHRAAVWGAVFVTAMISQSCLAKPVGPGGYLAGANIGYTVPAAPDDSRPEAQPDLDAVREAQSAPEGRRQQAFEDAGAYDYDHLLTRFSTAAATDLNASTSPVLAYVLRRVLNDVTGSKNKDGAQVDGYVTIAKTANPRARPYLQDLQDAEQPRIVPCETDYLYPSGQASYPSGHSANVYAAALLLATVMPERAAPILARGIRYGENRVICGVHHPSDVVEGQKIAAAYFAKLQELPAFQHDLACALDERRSSVSAPSTPVPRPNWKTLCVDVLRAAANAES